MRLLLIQGTAQSLVEQLFNRKFHRLSGKVKLLLLFVEGDQPDVAKMCYRTLLADCVPDPDIEDRPRGTRALPR